MGSTGDVRARSMDSRVYRECSGVEDTLRTGVREDTPAVVDVKKRRRGDQGEMSSEGIDPKRCWINRIANSNMTSFCMLILGNSER